MRRPILRRRLRAVGLAALAACAGCMGPLTGTIALHQAQDSFNDASTVANQRFADAFAKPSDAVLPETAVDKYRRVVELVNDSVLPKVDRDDLKLNALALLAFSEWQLGVNAHDGRATEHFKNAINAAATGEDRCDAGRVATNRRDCGMFMLTPGLVKHSQAFAQYQEILNVQHRFPTAAEAAQITGQMRAAVADLDKINATFPADEPIAQYGNLQQLVILDNETHVLLDVRPTPDHAALCTCFGDATSLVTSHFKVIGASPAKLPDLTQCAAAADANAPSPIECAAGRKLQQIQQTAGVVAPCA